MKLKPCPFCGNPYNTKPEITTLWQAFDMSTDHPDAGDIVVRCEYCGAVGEQCS